MAIALTAGLTACHSDSRSAPAAATTSTEASTTSSATSSTTSSTATTGIVRCVTSHLTVSLPSGDGAAGTTYFELAFRNVSGSTCEMNGYPGVSFLDASGAQIGVPAQRTGASYAQVDLAPDATAYSVLAVPNPDVRACPAATAHTVRVFPPNETRAVNIAVDDSNASGAGDGITVCAQQSAPGSIGPIVANSSR
jgi:hypothetical protein